MKRFCLVLALLILGGPSLFAFALLGPVNEGFQVPVIGYNLSGAPLGFRDVGGSADIGAPKNLAEEFRWNTPDIYYAYDANFLDYFGSNGVAAVDAAIATFNNLSNVSIYSSDLSEWPLNSTRVNSRAAALGLLDLKSATMEMLIEQLGLAQPDRWTWALHDRFPIPGAPCPNVEYIVIQRNFDPVTNTYSPFVNGVLYDYIIDELCPLNPNPFAPLLADAVEIVVDPDTIDSFSAVASHSLDLLNLGKFYTGLTRDDVGGLRYLYSSTNLNTEATENTSPSFVVITNNSQTPLVTSNLATFTQQALTNNPAALQALFPTLQIIDFSSTFSNVVTTNVTAFFTNAPFGSPGQSTLTFATNFTTNVLQVFHYDFGNVITNSVFSREFVTIVITNVGPAPFSPPGTVATNVTSNTFLTNIVSGEFFIIPSNQCGFSILSTQLATLVPFTNTIIATNLPGVTNANGQAFTENIITFFTNHTLIVSIPNCLSNSVALRKGIEKIHFFRQDFDSLLGQAWTPVTNTYTLTAVTNNVSVVQNVFRIATQPDILFTATDLTPGPGAVPAIFPYLRSNPNFDANQALAGLAGPGTIQPRITLTYNKVGPVFLNLGPFFLDASGDGTAGFPQSDSILSFLWGSFDGTTNDPVVYPDSVSLANLDNQVFLQITVSGPLPNGNVNQSYTAHLQATGAQPPPFTWTLAPNSPALPSGLNLSSTDGTISGTPTATGVFDFIVQVADTTGRINQRNFTIEIDP